MGISYGPRGELLMSDGRPMWRGLDGKALTNEEAEKLLASTKRFVCQTWIKAGRRERIRVSTIFLVHDHSFMEGRPVFYETMVFGGALDYCQWRWSTRREARAGHRAATAGVRALLQFEQAERTRRRRMHANYRARRKSAA